MNVTRSKTMLDKTLTTKTMNICNKNIWLGLFLFTLVRAVQNTTLIIQATDSELICAPAYPPDNRLDDSKP